MKHALRVSSGIAIFGKVPCEHGLCLIIRVKDLLMYCNKEIGDYWKECM